jgi:hypothetical protein
MKRNLVAMGLLAGSLVSSHPAVGKATVERVQSRGEIAWLALFDQTEIVCEDGSVGLLDTAVAMELFSDGVSSSLGDTDTEAIMLFFSEFSSCTATSREFLAFEEPEEYTQQRVQSGSFAHGFDMVDVFTAEPIGTLTVDVELTGIGPTDRINEHTSSQSGGFTFRSRVNGVSRQATASGTVHLDGTELIDAAPSASLSDIHSSDMTVTH